jgi:hypothetical protein
MIMDSFEEEIKQSLQNVKLMQQYNQAQLQSEVDGSDGKVQILNASQRSSNRSSLDQSDFSPMPEMQAPEPLKYSEKIPLMPSVEQAYQSTAKK